MTGNDNHKWGSHMLQLDNRAQILQASRELLAQAADVRLELAAIANQAQLPLGLVTEEFSTLDQLGEALVDDYMSGLLDQVLPLLEQAQTDTELVHSYVRAYLSYLASRPESRHPAMMGNANIRKAYRKMALGAVRTLMNAELEAAMQRGVLPRMPVALLLSMCFGVVMQAGRDVINQRLPMDEQTIHSVATFLLTGLRAIPPTLKSSPAGAD